MNDLGPNLRPKARLPFSPTVRPGFASASGGISGILYAIAAIVLGGYAVYQMRVQHLALTELRVALCWIGAGWFVIRAVMFFASGRTKREETE